MPYDPAQLETDVSYLTSLPQWQDESARPQFIRDVASHARSTADADTHRALTGALWERAKGGALAQGADFVQRSASEMLKSVPAAPAAAVLAASDAAGTTNSGSGTRLMRGVADLADATVQRVKRAPLTTVMPMTGISGALVEALVPSQQTVRDQTLAALKQDLDAGAHPPGFERWLAGDDKPDAAAQPWVEALTRGLATRAVAADHSGKPDPAKINAWLQTDRNPAFLDSDTPGTPGPRALLADYLVTRDPASWDAFQARVSETDSQYKTRLQRSAAEAPEFTPTVAAAPKGSLSQEMITRTADMQTSPLDLASAVLPVLRSMKILKAAHAGASGTSLLRRGATDAAKEFGQEALTEMVSNPNASTGQILEAGAMGGIGQGVISAPAAVAGRLLRPNTQPLNDNLPPNQAAAPTGAPQAPGTPPATAALGGMPAAVPSTLSRIALESLVPDLPQHTGDLTEAEVAGLEAANPTSNIEQGTPNFEGSAPANLSPSPPLTLPPLQGPTQMEGVGGGVRGGAGVPNPLPTVATPDPAQTITGSNVQTGTEMPVPPPTAEAGAGAGADPARNDEGRMTNGVAAPVLTAATLVRDTIHMDFDALAPKPTLAELRATFPGAMIEEMAPDVVSGTKGVVSFRVLVLNERGSMSSKRATELYQQAFGTQEKIRTQSKFQRMGPLDKRFEIGSAVAGMSELPEPDPKGFTHTTLKRDLESGFMTTAGADALLDLAHRAFQAGQTFAQWSQTMLQRFGESIRQWLAGVWDHAKRSSQTGALNFTGKLGNDLQKAGQALKGKPASPMASDSGAAQSNEPSPGGLSEAEFWLPKRRHIDDLFALRDAIVTKLPAQWSQTGHTLIHPIGKTGENLSKGDELNLALWEKPELVRNARSELARSSIGGIFQRKTEILAAWESEKQTVEQNKIRYDELTKEIDAAIESMRSSAKPIFLRWGKPPQNKRSSNWRDNIEEAGVSAYHAYLYPDGTIEIPNSTTAMIGAVSGFFDRSPYLINGKEIGTGSDGEPVVEITTSKKIVKNPIYHTGLGWLKNAPEVNPESSRAAGGTFSLRSGDFSSRMAAGEFRVGGAGTEMAFAPQETFSLAEPSPGGLSEAEVKTNHGQGFYRASDGDETSNIYLTDEKEDAERYMSSARNLKKYKSYWTRKELDLLSRASTFDKIEAASGVPRDQYSTFPFEELNRPEVRDGLWRNGYDSVAFWDKHSDNSTDHLSILIRSSEQFKPQKTQSRVKNSSDVPGRGPKNLSTSRLGFKEQPSLQNAEPSSLSREANSLGRTTSNVNQEYLAAVQRGDLQQAQELVDQAIEDVMPDGYWHGQGTPASLDEANNPNKSARPVVQENGRLRPLSERFPSAPEVNPESSRAAGGTSSLQPAYMAAMQGRSTAMVPIKDVYQQALTLDPTLTVERFMAEVQAGDNAGTVLLEPPEKAETVAAAGPFVLRNASGIPSTSMMVQRGFTHLDVSGQRSQAGFVMNPFTPSDAPGWMRTLFKVPSIGAFRVQNLSVRKLLTDSALPKAMAEIVTASDRDKQSIEYAAAALANDLEQAMKANSAVTGRTQQQVNDLVTDVLQGTLPVTVVLDPVMRTAIRRARNLLDNLSAAVAAATGGQLGTTILANLGSWMRRSYAAFDPAAGWSFDELTKAAAKGRKVAGEPAVKILADARRYLRSQNPGLATGELEAQMRQLMDRNLWEEALIGSGAGVRKDVSSLMKRKDIAPEIRALMGEERNPVKKLLGSAKWQAQFVAKHENQQKIRDVGLQLGMFSPSQTGRFTEELGEDRSTSGFAQNGRKIYTTPELRRALSQTTGVLATDDLGSNFLKMIYWLGGQAKLNKVALNPDSWMVNLLGNFTGLAMTGGLSPFAPLRLYQNSRKAIELLRAGKKQAAAGTQQQVQNDLMRQMMAKLTAAGVADSSMNAQLVEDALNKHLIQFIERHDVWNGAVGAVKLAVIGQALAKPFGAAGRAIGGAIGGAAGYAIGNERVQNVQEAIAKWTMQNPDRFGKIVEFLDNQTTLIAAGMTPEQAFAQATTKTLNTMPDYSKLPAVLRQFSRLGVVGSFIAFQWEVYRNSFHNARYIVEELSSGNPALMEKGARRLLGMGAVYALALGGLQALLGNDAGDDEKDEAYRRALGKPWEKYSRLAYSRLDTEKASFYNTSYLLPQVTLMELVRAAASGKDFGQALEQAGGVLQKQFAETGIHADPLLALLFNLDKGGQKATTEQGWRATLERLGEVLAPMTPGAADKFERLLRSKEVLNQPRWDREFSVEEEMKRLIGIRQATYSHARRIASRLSEFNSRKRDIATSAAQVYGEAGKARADAWGRQAQQAAADRATERLAALKAEYDQFVKDLGTLGFKPTQIERFRKDAGTSPNWKPYEITEEGIKQR